MKPTSPSRELLLLWLMSLVAVAATACTQADDPNADSGNVQLLEDPEGKDDSIGDRDLDFVFRGVEAWLPSTRYEASASVLVDDAQRVQVETERLVFRPTSDQDFIDIEVKPLTLARSFKDELQFGLFFRDADAEAWRQISLKGGDQRFDRFATVQIDLASAQMTFVAQDTTEDNLIEGTVDTGPLFSQKTEFAIAAFPAATWFSLRGKYPYRAHVSCSDKPCDGYRLPTTFPALHTFKDAAQFPESVDHDPDTDTIFTGNLKTGDVLQLDPLGQETVFVPGQAPFITLGVRADALHRRLWVCAVRDDDDDYPGRVQVFDMDTAALLHTFDLSDAFPKGSCNDLALHHDAVAYVTDRENPNVYKLDLMAKEVSIFAQDEDLLDSSGVGTNGIAVTPEGTHLVITNYLPSRMMVVAIDNPQQVHKIDLDGDLFHEVLGGADGIRFVDNTLYVVFPSKLARLSATDSSWQEARVQMTNIPDNGGMSGLALIGRDLHMTNGQVATYLLGRNPNPFVLQRFDWSLLDR